MTIEQRLDEILRELTFEEKLALLHQAQPAIERLGLPEFHTGQEGLHGLAWSGEATVFPQAIGLGSTWNPQLLQRIGVAVAREARACHHGDRPRVGLNVWAPVVDLLRDPRAGRNEEGYSEDPHLTGVLSTAYCQGLSHDDATAPTLKHFFAYNNEHNRVTTSSDVRPRLLHEYYLRAFEPAIRTGAAKAVMLSYNLVNGLPCHVSPYVEGVLRRWAPELVVVSDAFAPTNLADEQAYFETHEESHAAAMHAGLDSFTDRGPDPTFTTTTLRNAVAKGLLDEATIDAALRRLLRMRLRLAEADANDWPDVVNCAEHQALAREAVQQSIVLLRNDSMLPLDQAQVGTIAVVGPLAGDCLTDWYSGTLPYAVTPADGLRARLGEGGDRVVSHPGVDRIRFRIGEQPYELDAYDWGGGLIALRAGNGKFLTRKETGELVADQDQPNGWVVNETFRLHSTEWLEHVATETPYPITNFAVVADGVATAAELAARADVAVVVVGNHPMVGARETTDRAGIDLPARQSELVKAVLSANRKTILVVESSYPYALDWEDEHVPAILWLSHGGQETGNGLADVLFGDVSPSGRLTQTWYGSNADLEQIGGIGEYDIIETGRTYLYATTRPRYPFGHGLSYARFGYAGLRWTGGTASVAVTNLGDVPATEIVQFYIRRVSPSRVRYPELRLAGFRTIELQPHETAEVSVDLTTDDFAHWDVRQHRFVVEAGEYELLAGRSSADLPVSATAQIDGEQLPDRDPFRPIEAVDFDAQQGVRIIQSPLAGDALTVPASGWVSFNDMKFARAATTFVVSGCFGDGGRVELRLDDPAGEPLAAVDVPPGGSTPGTWLQTRTSIPATTGRHDLYLDLAGGVQISQFWFE